VTNSSLQLLLKQSPASIDSIGKTFNLTQGERSLLLESNVGEGSSLPGKSCSYKNYRFIYRRPDRDHFSKTVSRNREGRSGIKKRH